MKKIISSLLLFAVIATTSSSLSFGANEIKAGSDTVNVPDANFKACINGYLSKGSTEDITVSEMESLDAVICTESGIKDITGIDKAVNLTQLVLAKNQITDISPISRLTNLTMLDISGNLISDISPVSGLTSLFAFILNDNQITDFTPIGSLSIFALTLDSQHIKIDLGVFKNLNDIPKEYKLKILEGDGTEHEIVIPLDKVVIGDNQYTQTYGFGDYTGDVNVTLKYAPGLPAINGVSDATIHAGDSFDVLGGITATDPEDGDLTSKIVITKNDLDNSKAGTYTITYSVTDSDGNTTEISRTITVLAKVVEPSKPGKDTSTPTNDKEIKLMETGSNLNIITLLILTASILIKKYSIKF